MVISKQADIWGGQSSLKWSVGYTGSSALGSALPGRHWLRGQRAGRLEMVHTFRANSPLFPLGMRFKQVI